MATRSPRRPCLCAGPCPMRSPPPPGVRAGGAGPNSPPQAPPPQGGGKPPFRPSQLSFRSGSHTFRRAVPQYLADRGGELRPLATEGRQALPPRLGDRGIPARPLALDDLPLAGAPARLPPPVQPWADVPRAREQPARAVK